MTDSKESISLLDTVLFIRCIIWAQRGSAIFKFNFLKNRDVHLVLHKKAAILCPFLETPLQSKSRMFKVLVQMGFARLIGGLVAITIITH